MGIVKDHGLVLVSLHPRSQPLPLKAYLDDPKLVFIWGNVLSCLFFSFISERKCLMLKNIFFPGLYI